MVNIGVVSQVAERLQTQDFRKLENFKKIPEMLGMAWKVLSRPPKKQIFTLVLENCKRSAVKYFIEKRILTKITKVVSGSKICDNRILYSVPF